MSKEKKNNLPVKIFALIIALLLWVYVMDEVDPIKEKDFRNIQVQYKNIASLERQGLEIMEPQDIAIRVTISGKTSNVLEVSEEDIIAEVDLEGYQEGKAKAIISVDVPNKVELVDFTPKEVLFSFDKVIKKDRTVDIEIQGELPEGYVLGEAEISPDSIEIEGPRTWVNGVSKVLAIVDVTDRTEDFTISRPLNLLDDKDNEVRGVEKNQNSVDIFIPVYEIKKVPIELQTKGELPDNYEILDISLEPSVVEIKGKKADLANINSIKTNEIDINSLIGAKNVEVKLDIPENISLVNPDEKIKVTLNVDESKVKTLKYTLNDVKVINLNPDLFIEEEGVDTSFEITVKGSSSKIDLLQKEDLNIELDLADLEEGTHLISPIVEEEEHIEIISILPESFDINLINKEDEDE